MIGLSTFLTTAISGPNAEGGLECAAIRMRFVDCICSISQIGLGLFAKIVLLPLVAVAARFAFPDLVRQIFDRGVQWGALDQIGYAAICDLGNICLNGFVEEDLVR